MSGPTLAGLRVTGPAFALALAGLAVLALALRRREGSSRRSEWIALVGVAAAATWSIGSPVPARGTVLGMVAADGCAAFLGVLLLAGALAVLLGWLTGPRAADELSARRAFLLLTGTAGACWMVGTEHGLLMLEGAAIVSLSGTGLAALDSGHGAESALKQFFTSAFALALSLYGASLLFGLGGSLDLMALARGSDSATGLERQFASDPFPAALALALFCASFLQLAAAAPLHAWAVDVADAASPPVATYFNVIARTAGLGALARVVAVLFVRDRVSPSLAEFAPRAGLCLAIVAAVTMALGALSALQQPRLRRMLAWSSVAQTGVLLLGIAAARETGLAVFFAGAAWLAVMQAGTWIAARRLERAAGSDRVEDLRGLFAREPVAAACLLCFLAGAAGLPATLGGYVDFRLCLEAWAAGQGWLVVVVGVALVLTGWCWVRVARALLAGPPRAGEADGPRALQLACAALALAALCFGLWPRPLDLWAQSALDFLRE